MTIERLDRHTVVISRIDPLVSQLLQKIVSSADPGEDPRVVGRLYSSPSGGREPDFDRDWTEYVEPDLRRLFQGSLDIVREDVARLTAPARRRDGALHIRVENLDAWIHALNQARLAISARHDFTEDDMNSRAPVEGDARAQALFQVHFYGFLQECFLREKK